MTSLLQLCTQFTTGAASHLPSDHPIGKRLVCPEYSKSGQEVKTYPFLNNDRLFLVCWNLEKGGSLLATMKPSPISFCYHRTYQPGDKTQLHTHDYLELAYIVDGSFSQRILGKDITFSKGELCLIDKNCLHQDYLLDQSATVLFLGLANEIFDEIMVLNITTKKIISFLQSALLKQKSLRQYLHFKPTGDVADQMTECLIMLLRELDRNDTGSPFICKGLLIRVFRLLSTRYEFSLSSEQRRTMNSVMFEEISDYIKNHYAAVTINDLVSAFHFQEDYFNRLIKDETGLTYCEYVQQIRLSAAKHMLLSSTKSIEDIIELVGYRNKGYFYKIFREKYGTTPSVLRKKYGQ